MRTVRRLRLRFFTFYDSLCRAVHSVTLCPVETMAGPSKIHCCYLHFSQCAFQSAALDNPVALMVQCIFGGPGESRTRVQNTFLFASYSNNLNYTL